MAFLATKRVKEHPETCETLSQKENKNLKTFLSQPPSPPKV